MFDDVPFDSLLATLAEFDHEADGGPTCSSRIDALTALERLAHHVAALQLEQVQALLGACRGTGDLHAELSVAGQVAMARGVSPSAGGTQLGHAGTYASMPMVAAALREGRISYRTFQAISREIAGLHGDDQTVVDAELAEHLHDLGPRRAADLTRHLVVGIDAEAAATRAEAVRADKRVELYPEPDGVASLFVRGPAEDVLAIHQSLLVRAETQQAAGDPRTGGQIMFETLLAEVTGYTTTHKPDVELQLLLDAPTLVGASHEPVDLVGYGPLAPDVAEQIVAHARSASVRRLLTDPVDGTLVARDPRRRLFSGGDAFFVRTRDGRCRQPGCECRIRHLDHVKAYQDDGPTTVSNGQGLCVRSHTTRHLPGWSVTQHGRSVVWTTPTGHTYTSKPPPLRPLLHRRT